MKSGSSRMEKVGWYSFTLIELLIVIAVIAILAGLLLPALNKAKAKAKEIECATTLKQLAVASQIYVSDYDGWLPNHCCGKWWIHSLAVIIDPNASWNWNWTSATPAAVRKTFQCKSGESEIYIGVNYMYNKTIGFFGGFAYPSISYMGPKRMSSVRNPSGKIQIIDGACKTASDIGIDSRPSVVNPVHASGANILWIDGHVKCHKYSEILAYSSEWML